MDLYLRVLEECRQDGINKIYFNTAWGEPMLHPEIFDMMDAASDFQVVLSTNATPLTAKRIAKLVEANLQTIQVSFAGYDKKSYESVYVGGRFERVSENIRAIKAGLTANGSNTHFLVNGVSLHDDPDFIIRTYEFLEGLGVEEDEIVMTLPSNYAGLYDPSRQNSEGIKTLKPLRDEMPVICSVLADNPGILYDGRVTVCGCLDDAGALVIGRIGEESLMEMRRGPKFRELIDQFIAGDISNLPLCVDCDVPYGESRLQTRTAAQYR